MATVTTSLNTKITVEEKEAFSKEYGSPWADTFRRNQNFCPHVQRIRRFSL